MEGNSAVLELKTMQHFFHNSISVLSEEDSGFKPVESAWTVAQQLRHTAYTIDWFTDGVFSGKGFNEDWEGQMKHIFQATSLTAEKEAFDRAVERACEVWGKLSEEELNRMIPENTIMGVMPYRAVVGAINDHTAHHRGSLATYTRILGKVAKMPYGE